MLGLLSTLRWVETNAIVLFPKEEEIIYRKCCYIVAIYNKIHLRDIIKWSLHTCDLKKITLLLVQPTYVIQEVEKPFEERKYVVTVLLYILTGFCCRTRRFY